MTIYHNWYITTVIVDNVQGDLPIIITITGIYVNLVFYGCVFIETFFIVVAVTVLILVIVFIVVILLVMRIVLLTVKIRKCKFDILIMTTSFNIKYIGTKNVMLQQDDKDSNKWNSEL